MKIKLIIFIMCVQDLTALKPESFLKTSSSRDNANLVKAINFIIENIFLKCFSTVNIISAVENAFDLNYLDFKNALLRENKGYCIYRLDNFKKIQGIRNRLKIYNIFLLDSITSFRILFENITPEKFNYSGRYLFVLIEDMLKERGEIFALMWKKGIINTNIIYEINDLLESTVQLETYMPFQENACGNTSCILLDTLKNGNFNIEVTEIFPEKVQNLFGCELRMVTFDRCPASCVEMIGGEATVKGFDIAIIDLIAERINFRLRKKILLGFEQWGNVFPNGTTVPKGNAIEKILNNKSDIAIGNYLLRPSRVHLMDNSQVYFNFPVLFAIPLGERYTAFENLMRPFELIVWILLLITLGIGLLVILLLNSKWRKLRSFVYGTGIKNPVINM